MGDGRSSASCSTGRAKTCDLQSSPRASQIELPLVGGESASAISDRQLSGSALTELSRDLEGPSALSLKPRGGGVIL